MAMVPMANLALDGGDPRMSVSGPGHTEISNKAMQLLHDPSITIEEYMYYAAISRAEEQRLHGPNTASWVPFRPTFQGDVKEAPEVQIQQAIRRDSRITDEKRAMPTDDGSGASSPGANPPLYLGVPDEEWVQASRAARTASWGAIFYLITTDILGPTTVPWALSQMGWGPGVALYFIFGVFAFYAGFQMWQMFMVLDSDKYPLKTYGDIAFRVFGRGARYGVNILQSIQLFFNVGILILSDGQAIYQLSQGPSGGKGLCFVVCSLVFAIAGLLLGQIRTLKKFGWIANLAIWLNVLVIIITVAIAATYAPNYQAANAQNLIPLAGPGEVQEPVMHYAGVNPTIGFQGQVVGLMQAVYSYGGAMLYCEFMSEMKKPWDFFKAQLCAEAFIFICYIFFGCFVYAYQGQYTIQPANQGLSPYTWQSATNAINLFSALIAACLYGNIGIKVLYQNVLREMFNAPALETKRGKLLWVGMVPIYWLVAFIVCAAIPNITNFSGLVAAACIMQFSYTFPPIMMLGLDIQRDAILPEEHFDPATGVLTRVDQGWKRWSRGMKKRVLLKSWYTFFALGSLATAVLGIYSSIVGLHHAFVANPNVDAFGCAAPI
ncbi:MAG: hypothetical protein M1827_001758 [Pycnora praestabilis]|nr:MAG: hypothetical protein M1827_001758 [Pycnora praestabilis]